MGLAARTKSSDVAEDMEIDLKPFINFLVVLIPVLMLSAEFAKISVINMKLPEGRGSNTAEAQTQRPIDDESDKLNRNDQKKQLGDQLGLRWRGLGSCPRA